jgi:peptide methionine sulfoxide reductase MsrA
VAKLKDQIVYGVAGGCFWCDEYDGDLIIKTISCAFDNGEPTSATLAVCKKCKDKR